MNGAFRAQLCKKEEKASPHTEQSSSLHIDYLLVAPIFLDCSSVSLFSHFLGKGSGEFYWYINTRHPSIHPSSVSWNERTTSNLKTGDWRHTCEGDMIGCDHAIWKIPFVLKFIELRAVLLLKSSGSLTKWFRDWSKINLSFCSCTHETNVSMNDDDVNKIVKWCKEMCILK